MRRVALLGGTFDPIHCGHLDLARAAQAALGLTNVFFVTANIPPHREQPVASSYHRFAMVALAIAGHRGWQASDVELRVGTPSFTTGTLERFQHEGYAPTELFFVIGTDAFADIEAWKDYPALLDRASFAVVSRPGFPASELPGRLPQLASRMTRPTDGRDISGPLIFLIDAVTADVSSTAIRDRRLQGQSIADLVTPGVQQHIEQHGLYSTGRRLGDRPRASAAGRLHGQE
jgi:nicotinate-nucleotide adenylyltransferase